LLSATSLGWKCLTADAKRVVRCSNQIDCQIGKWPSEGAPLKGSVEGLQLHAGGVSQADTNKLSLQDVTAAL